MTAEDPAPARSLAHAGHICRTCDLEAADVRNALHAAPGVEGLEPVIRLRQGPCHERRAELVRARRDRDANVLEALPSLARELLLLLIGVLQVLGSADLALEDLPAIDHQDDFV